MLEFPRLPTYLREIQGAGSWYIRAYVLQEVIINYLMLLTLCAG
jgi:hypothetical protein